jgi:hypothetical protein
MTATMAPEAELAVIGSLVQQPAYADQVMRRITPADFMRHERQAAVLWQMITAKRIVDPQTYRAELVDRQAIPREQAGPFVLEAVEAAWLPESVGAYADLVIQATQRRKLLQAASTLTRAVEAGNSVVDVAATTIEAITAVIKETQLDDQPSMTLNDLLKTPMEQDWVIPGLLERMDRFIVSAGEGSGKSTFLRMVAICAASGRHPFVNEPMSPMKVLMVDCENSLKQSARKFRGLVKHMRGQGYDPGENLVYQSRPEGLDLASPKDAAWLLNRVTVDQPELLTIGPAYRLCTAVSDDDIVRQVLDAVDAARLRARCAVILEAHPGQGQQWSKERDLRPKGSQLWRAWPESIRGLRRDEDDPTMAKLEFAGRGDRDERYWPESMRVGYADELPWIAMTPEDADAKREQIAAQKAAWKGKAA